MAALREVLAHFGVTLDAAPLEKGDKLVDGFKEKLLGMGKVLAGAFAVTQIVSFGREVLNQADVLAKQSSALGVSAAELQGWQHAAQLSGSSAEEFTAAFTKFSRNVAEAAESAKGPAAEAFKTLGLSATDAAGNLKRPADLLDGVADSLAGMEDPAKRTQVVMDLFGKSGAKLLPLFSEGSVGIAKLRAEVGELGASFDEAFLENAQEFNDNVDRLKLGLKGLFIQAIGPLLPELASMTKGMVSAVKTGITWLKSTKLVQAVITGFTVRGVLALARAIPLVIAKMGGWRMAFATLGRFILRTLLPLLLLEDAIGFFSGDDSLIGDWIDRAFGAGSQQKVREFFTTTIAEFKRLAADGDAAYVQLGNSSASWVQRAVAGLALLVGGSRSTWSAIKEGWASVWLDVQTSFAEFALWLDEKWNALIDALPLPAFMKIDTGKGSGQRVEDLKRQKDELQAKAYRRENQKGEFETPEAAAERAKNAAAGVGEVRDIDLTPIAKVAADYLKKTQMGGGPNSGPYRLDEEGRYAPGAVETPYVPGTAQQLFAAAPPVAHAPAGYTDARVDVGGVRVQQSITVAPGTEEEQARELGRGAAKGVRDAMNTRQVQDALVHTAG